MYKFLLDEGASVNAVRSGDKAPLCMAAQAATGISHSYYCSVAQIEISPLTGV